MTISTRKCSTCGITIGAPPNPAQIIPDHWIQDPRSYLLVCGACHIRAVRGGWRAPAPYEVDTAKKLKTLELIGKGMVG